MGGLPCRKIIIDQGNAAISGAQKKLAGLEQAVSCMQASVTMAVGEDALDYPEQEMIIEANRRLQSEIAASFDAFAKICSTLEQKASATWS